MANELNIRLVLDGNQFRAELRNSGGSVQTFAAETKQGVDRAAASLESLVDRARGVARSLTALVGISIGATLASDVVHASDAYTNLSSKIHLVTDSERQANAVRAQTLAIANTTRQVFENTAELYTRMSRATESLSLTQAQTLRLTETINKSFVVSGAAAQEASAAIIQLSQGLAAGALRGDEFNSVTEQAPVFMEMLTKSLGVTRGELRAMAEDGQLSAEIITRALLEGSAEIDQQFAGMAITVSGAWQQLKNEAVAFVGSASEATAASTLLAGAISLLASGFAPLATAVTAVSIVVGANYVAALVAGVLAKRAAAAESALLATAELNAARAAEAEALALVTKHRAMTAAGIVTAEATVAENAYAAAVARTQAAVVASTGATAGLRGAMLALVGGPIGLAVLAVGALGVAVYNAIEAEREHREAIDAGLESMALAADSAERLADGYDRVGGASFAKATGELAQMNEKLIAQQQLLDEVAERAERLHGVGVTARFGAVSNPQADQAIADALRLEAAMAAIRREMNAVAAAAAQQFAPALDTAAESLRNATQAAAGGDLVGAWNTLTAGLRGARTELQGIADADAQTSAFVDALKAKLTEASTAADTAGLSAVKLAEHYVAQGIASAEAANKSDEFIAALRAQGAQYVDLVAKTEAAKAAKQNLAKAERDQERASRDQIKAMDAVLAGYDDWQRGMEDLAAQLSGPMAQAQLDYDRKLQDAEQAARRLGLTSDELRAYKELLRKEFEATARAIRTEQDVLGQLETDYAEQIRIARLSDAERQIEIASLQAITQWRQTHGGAIDAETEARIRQTVRAGEAELSMIEAARDHAAEYERAWGSAIDSVGNAFGEWIADGMSSFKDFGDELVSIAKRMVAQLIAEFAKVQIARMFSGSTGALGAAASTFLGSTGSASASTGGFGDLSTWTQAGRSLWNSFAGSAASSAVGTGSSMFGTYTGSNFVGPLANGQSYGFAPSTAGYAMAGAAGLYAGYNRYQNSNGGLAGGLGAASYGLGTYGAAMGVGSMMAGGTFAAGMAGAFSAIPVVGWVALAAMVVDKLAGGKLFGTAYRPESTESTLSLANGGTASLSMTEVRQRSLFRGRSWRTTDMEASDEAQDAAEAFYANIYSLMVSSANQLAIDVPPVIDAALRTVNEYDKKGKVTATKIFVDVLGRSWEEATEELATTRLSAEAIIATVDAALAQVVYNGLQKGSPALQMDGGSGGDLGDAGDAINTASAIMGEASQIAERWRDDAEQLMVGAQYLLAATTDMRAGNALLGDGVSLTAVTDFVDEMSQGAETILETYTRLSASAGMLEQALDLSGTALDLTREEFVRFAADITDAAGGLDRASALWADYFQRFYSPSELLDYQAVGANAAAQSEFSDIGLSVSDYTGDGGAAAFRALFEEQLPTLSAEAVVEWLEAAAALGIVLDLQSQQNAVLQEQADALADYNAQVASLQDEIDAASMSEFALEMRDINRWSADAIESLNASARAAGLQAASEEDLALVHQIAAQRAAAAIERLRASAADLVAELYGSPLDTINEQISAMEAAQHSSIESVGEAAQDMYAAQLSALQGIKEWLDGQLLGDLSTLTPEQQLAEAQRQFESTLARAQSGDVDALQSITGQADALLRMGRDYYASSEQYTAIEQMVRGGMQGLVNAGPTAAQLGGQNNVGGSGGVSPELQALYAERDAAMASAEAAQREALMAQLGGMIRELIQATGQPLAEVASSIGLNLSTLAEDLGINLNDLSAQTASSLVDMARTLGVDVAELAANVGVSLGNLADRQSLLNQALDQTLADVPAEFREQLSAPLEAIRSATTEADSTAAVNAAEAAINAMPQGIRDQLAPYFDDVFPAAAVTELTQLSAMKSLSESHLSATLDANELLQRIVDNLAGANTAAGIPAFAAGGWVNGPTTLLAGEAGRELILPNPVSEFLTRAGIPINTSGDSRDVVSELRALRESNERTQRELIQRVEQLERAQRDGAERIARETQRQTDLMATGGR